MTDREKGKQEADAYLSALLRYTGEFYGAAIEYGMPAGHAADTVAHVEKAARHLHQMVINREVM